MPYDLMTPEQYEAMWAHEKPDLSWEEDVAERQAEWEAQQADPLRAECEYEDCYSICSTGSDACPF